MDLKRIASVLGAFAAGALVTDIARTASKQRAFRDNIEEVIDETVIRTAVEAMNGLHPDVDRKGAARCLALACTKALRYHLAAPELYRSVVKALTIALDDPDPSVRHAAEQGLDALRS